MPQAKYYTVRQEREVKVCTNDIITAVTLAALVFDGENVPPDRVEMRVLSPVHIRSIDAREDY